MDNITETAAAGSISAGAVAGARGRLHKKSSVEKPIARKIPNVREYKQFKKLSFKEFLDHINKGLSE